VAAPEVKVWGGWEVPQRCPWAEPLVGVRGKAPENGGLGQNPQKLSGFSYVRVQLL